MASPMSLTAFPEAGIMPRDDTEVSSNPECERQNFLWPCVVAARRAASGQEPAGLIWQPI